jgi:hypothetical protein
MIGGHRDRQLLGPVQGGAPAEQQQNDRDDGSIAGDTDGSPHPPDR